MAVARLASSTARARSASSQVTRTPPSTTSRFPEPGHRGTASRSRLAQDDGSGHTGPRKVKGLKFFPWQQERSVYSHHTRSVLLISREKQAAGCPRERAQPG